MASSLVRYLDQKLFPEYQNNWDDELFRKEVLGYLNPDMVVLNLGAGAGIVEQMNFRGLVKRVAGVDLDPRVTENPYRDEVNCLRGHTIVDTFPTLHRANSKRDFIRMCEQADLKPQKILLHEGRPEYLRIFAPAYILGFMYQRIVQSFDALAQFRVVLIGVAQKYQ